MPAEQPSPLVSLMPLIIVFGIFYFLIIRPQNRKLKLHQEFLKNLKRGDTVVTTGGIFGAIEGITDHFVTLEIAPGVNIKVLRRQIAGSQSALLSEAQGPNAKSKELKKA